MTNPLCVVPEWAFAVVDLYLACRAQGGFAGAPVLPCAGGPADQPAALMDAFLLLDAWMRET